MRTCHAPRRSCPASHPSEVSATTLFEISCAWNVRSSSVISSSRPSHCASRRDTVVPRSNVPSRSNTTTGKRPTVSGWLTGRRCDTRWWDHHRRAEPGCLAAARACRGDGPGSGWIRRPTPSGALIPGRRNRLSSRRTRADSARGRHARIARARRIAAAQRTNKRKTRRGSCDPRLPKLVLCGAFGDLRNLLRFYPSTQCDGDVADANADVLGDQATEGRVRASVPSQARPSLLVLWEIGADQGAQCYGRAWDQSCCVEWASCPGSRSSYHRTCYHTHSPRCSTYGERIPSSACTRLGMPTPSSPEDLYTRLRASSSTAARNAAHSVLDGAHWTQTASAVSARSVR